MSAPATPLILLSELDLAAFLAMFWFMLLFEVPRYTLSSLVVFLAALRRSPEPSAAERERLDALRVSVVVAGHNEADAMAKCLRSLGEQSRRIDEIIVIDDGSTDGMRAMINELARDGRIDIALANQVRCGKAASCNFGFTLSTGDIVVNLDADCSYDRDAIERLIEPFVDPRVGATTGAIAVRNRDASMVTALQTIEYAVSIAMGKRAVDMLDMVVCASGAFGAFRRTAVDQIGIMVPGPGEDFDLTLRLRRAGWRIRFAPHSWCFTDVPANAAALVRQRRRWDRDTVRTRLRKFRDTFSPATRRFTPLETFEQCEWLVMNLLFTLVFPLYVTWLFVVFDLGAFYVLGLVAIVYLLLDTLSFAMAAAMARRFDRATILAVAPYLLVFGLYNGVFMRLVRLYAYWEEWVYRRSFEDSYSPSRVGRQAFIFRG